MAVTQTNSFAHIKSDPLKNFSFRVKWPVNASGATVDLGFMSVAGLNTVVEVIAYREGGMNTTTQKMPGQADFSPITMSRGVAVGDDQAVKWLKQLFTVMQGTGSGAPGNDFRRTIEIQVLDHPVTDRPVSQRPVKARFKVYAAWPTAVSFSDLDAGASQLLIQQITIAHEGWDMSLARNIGTDQAPNLRG